MHGSLFATRTLGCLVKRREIGMAFFMAYTVTSDTLGLAIGPMAETANDVHEALSTDV
jgi:hypothetical protein